jgi:hypothetical protein
MNRFVFVSLVFVFLPIAAASRPNENQYSMPTNTRDWSSTSNDDVDDDDGGGGVVVDTSTAVSLMTLRSASADARISRSSTNRTTTSTTLDSADDVDDDDDARRYLTMSCTNSIATSSVEHNDTTPYFVRQVRNTSKITKDRSDKCEDPQHLAVSCQSSFDRDRIASTTDDTYLAQIGKRMSPMNRAKIRRKRRRQRTDRVGEKAAELANDLQDVTRALDDVCRRRRRTRRRRRRGGDVAMR